MYFSEFFSWLICVNASTGEKMPHTHKLIQLPTIVNLELVHFPTTPSSTPFDVVRSIVNDSMEHSLFVYVVGVCAASSVISSRNRIKSLILQFTPIGFNGWHFASILFGYEYRERAIERAMERDRDTASILVYKYIYVSVYCVI